MDFSIFLDFGGKKKKPTGNSTVMYVCVREEKKESLVSTNFFSVYKFHCTGYIYA